MSLTVEAGEIFGIVGPNGAGKTTTVELIQGLRTPDRGRVRVLGLDPWRDRDELRQRVGAQLQQSDLYDKVRVGEALELFASFYRDPADPGRLLEQLGLTGKRNTSFDKLSGGQRQRLSIALALVGNPEVAILDELSTGLDPHARRDTWRLIEQVRAGGVTVVLVSHYMEEIGRLCDRVAVLDAPVTGSAPHAAAGTGVNPKALVDSQSRPATPGCGGLPGTGVWQTARAVVPKICSRQIGVGMSSLAGAVRVEGMRKITTLLSGIALFSADATALVGNRLMQMKLLAIALGLANVALFHMRWAHHLHEWDRVRPRFARTSALLSMCLWLTVPIAGRLIAYV